MIYQSTMNQIPQPCQQCCYIKNNAGCINRGKNYPECFNIVGTMYGYKKGMKVYLKKCCLYAYYTGGCDGCMSPTIKYKLVSKMKRLTPRYVVMNGELTEVYEAPEKQEETITVEKERIRIMRCMGFIFPDDTTYDILTEREAQKYMKVNRRVEASEEPFGIQYVYLIRERTAVVANQSIYKIGKTAQKNFDRFKGYGKGYEVLLHMACDNCHDCETAIITTFDNKYRKAIEYGAEYYEGDYKSMMMDIIAIVFHG